MKGMDVRGGRFSAYWLFNIILGIPAPYALIWIILGYYGFMSPPGQEERLAALGVLAAYLTIWFAGNYFCLRKEDAGTRIGLQALSPLIIGASAFLSYRFVVFVSSM